MLEADLEALSERGSGIRECFEAVGKATKHLGIQSGADQEIQTFLNTAVLVSTYNAFVSLNEGEPGKARGWWCVRGRRQYERLETTLSLLCTPGNRLTTTSPFPTSLTPKCVFHRGELSQWKVCTQGLELRERCRDCDWVYSHEYSEACTGRR
jgi:hypothetical protein